MSEFGHVGSTRVISSNSDEDEPQTIKSEEKESDRGHKAMMDKTEEFFKICDSEGKGFITSTDMRVKYA